MTQLFIIMVFICMCSVHQQHSSTKHFILFTVTFSRIIIIFENEGREKKFNYE